jgi:hypothetical protein
MLKASGTVPLKLNCDKQLSGFAFYVSLRRYDVVGEDVLGKHPAKLGLADCVAMGLVTPDEWARLAEVEAMGGALLQALLARSFRSTASATPVHHSPLAPPWSGHSFLD